MKKNFENLLPVGTIVRINNFESDIMISGYFGVCENKTINRYMGISYPIGVINEKGFYSFNDEDIEKIIFKGYVDSTFDGFKKGLDLYSKIK